MRHLLDMVIYLGRTVKHKINTSHSVNKKDVSSGDSLCRGWAGWERYLCARYLCAHYLCARHRGLGGDTQTQNLV